MISYGIMGATHSYSGCITCILLNADMNVVMVTGFLDTASRRHFFQKGFFLRPIYEHCQGLIHPIIFYFIIYLFNRGKNRFNEKLVFDEKIYRHVFLHA